MMLKNIIDAANITAFSPSTEHFTMAIEYSSHLDVILYRIMGFIHEKRE